MSKKGKKKQTSQGNGASRTEDRRVRNRPTRMFNSEGYSVSCRLDGLEIRATDYHAGVLKISWPDIARLMVEAGWAQDCSNGRSEDDDQPQIH